MAVKLSEINGISNSTNLKYVADEESEKNDIPAEDKIQGTEVLVIESGKSYKMNSNGEWIQKSSSGGGGSDLPSVTAADNGDVLTVVDGAWAKATPSGISGTDEWKGLFQNLAFIYYEAVSNTSSDISLILPQATVIGNASWVTDAETGDSYVEFGGWMTEDLEPIPDELEPYVDRALPAIRHDFTVANRIKDSSILTWFLPNVTITTVGE